MRTVRSIVLLHLAAWLLLSVLYFFLSESITHWLFAEIAGVELWPSVVAIGLLFIFAVTGASLLICLKLRKKKS